MQAEVASRKEPNMVCGEPDAGKGEGRVCNTFSTRYQPRPSTDPLLGPLCPQLGPVYPTPLGVSAAPLSMTSDLNLEP